MSERDTNEPLSFGEPDEITKMLGELKDVDPPADLVGTVMAKISSGAAVRARRVEPIQFSGGKKMAKKVLWSVMGAAAAVLIVLKIAGYPPKSDGTEGTIGAAQRYQSQQIADGDVKVTDAGLQKFMQSDAFHTLINDKAARQALANKDVQKALADPVVRRALVSDQIHQLLANDLLRQELLSDQAREALVSDKARELLSNDLLRLALGNEALRLVLANDLLAEAIASPALIGMLSAPGFAEAIASPGFAPALVAEGVAAGN
jgi:predicted pyridoxine 5'-phosphate oxidase superfamily flavin-nucleotide-binding protein